jgi:hypothetical protein
MRGRRGAAAGSGEACLTSLCALGQDKAERQAARSSRQRSPPLTRVHVPLLQDDAKQKGSSWYRWIRC